MGERVWEMRIRERGLKGNPKVFSIYVLAIGSGLIWAFLLTEADVLRLSTSENRTINRGGRVKAIRLS